MTARGLDAASIFARRRELGLSREALARRIGCGVSSVYRWERGISVPSPVLMVLLRAALEESK